MLYQLYSRCRRGAAAARSVRGFTLVEMLVVITIIASLVALLLPAVNAAREASRRATCTNNQKQLTLAMINYESAKRSFPGYVNQMSGVSTNYPVSWVVALLPYLDRKDLQDQWQTDISKNGVPDTKSIVSLPFAICPSDPPDAPQGALAYVVNRGRNGLNTNPAVGICFDRSKAGIAAKSASVSLEYIGAHDGASTTLLLSESLQTPSGSSNFTNAAVLPTMRPFLNMVQTVASGKSVPNDGTGTTYYRRPFSKWNSPYWGSGSTYDYDSGTYTAAQAASVCEMDLTFEWSSLATYASGAATATPRTGATLGDQIGSRHGGLFIASFCDGHTSRLDDGIDLDVYKQLMTPWGAGYTTYDTATPPAATNDGPTDVLDEGRF